MDQIARNMKAAVIYRSGGPESIVLEDRAIPQTKDGWVLIKVKALGLNRSELMTRKGYSTNVQFPRIVGIECVGEIVDDPSGEMEPGQKVAACMGGMGRDFDGSYAEYTLLPKDLLCKFDSHLSWIGLGALPEMFHTVYGSLHLALKIQPGETLLIRGGTSSIGMLAIQVAKNCGLVVIATTRNPGNKDLLLQNGADHVLIDDGKLAGKLKMDFPNGVDKILELVGTVTLKDSLASAKAGGSVCMTGMLAEEWSIADFAPMEYIPATVNLTIYDSGQIQLNPEDFQRFILDIEAGLIKISIGKSFTLDEIAAAHQLMESNMAYGKIVVVV